MANLSLARRRPAATPRNEPATLAYVPHPGTSRSPAAATFAVAPRYDTSQPATAPTPAVDPAGADYRPATPHPGYSRLEPGVARARLVLMGAYAANGLLLSTWFSRLPSVAARLHIDSDRLAIVTLALTVATLLAIPVSARRLPTWRATRIVRVTAPLTPVAMLIAVTSLQVWQLVLALLMVGALNGVQGVGLNAHATTLSRLADRPFMPTMIGAASAAGVFGGAIATLAAAAGVPLLVHVGVISGFCMICLLAVSRQIPVGGGSSSLRIVRAAAARTARHTAQRIERVGTLTAIRRRPATRDDAARKRPASRTTPKRHRPAAAAGPSVDTPMRSDPTMRLLIGAGLGACLAEGGIATFSIVIFRDQIGATIAVATLSFTIFSVSMASVRLIGGSLMQSVGPRRLLVLGGLLAAGCGLVLVARPALLIALLALAGVAAGIACAVPVTLHLATERARAAARTLGANEDRATASALSRLGLATGGGYLAGGPLLGAIAGLVGLHSALLLITAGGLALAACAGVLGRLDS